MEEKFVRRGFFFETFWANSSGGVEGLETFFKKKSPLFISISLHFLFHLLSSFSSCLSFSLSSSLFLSSLFSSLDLLLSSLSSSLFSLLFHSFLLLFLSFSLLSLSSFWLLSLSPRDVVCFCSVWCVCRCGRVCVWCVCCGTLKKTWKNPCAHSKRPVCTGTTRTRVSCGRGAGTHGDVLNVHMGTFSMDTRGAGGSSPVLLTRFCPRMEIKCFRGSPNNF